MKKFKVGDLVIRKNHDWNDVKKGEIRIITDIKHKLPLCLGEVYNSYHAPVNIELIDTILNNYSILPTKKQ